MSVEADFIKSEISDVTSSSMEIAKEQVLKTVRDQISKQVNTKAVVGTAAKIAKPIMSKVTTAAKNQVSNLTLEPKENCGGVVGAAKQLVAMTSKTAAPSMILGSNEVNLKIATPLTGANENVCSLTKDIAKNMRQKLESWPLTLPPTIVQLLRARHTKYVAGAILAGVATLLIYKTIRRLQKKSKHDECVNRSSSNTILGGKTCPRKTTYPKETIPNFAACEYDMDASNTAQYYENKSGCKKQLRQPFRNITPSDISSSGYQYNNLSVDQNMMLYLQHHHNNLQTNCKRCSSKDFPVSSLHECQMRTCTGAGDVIGETTSCIYSPTIGHHSPSSHCHVNTASIQDTEKITHKESCPAVLCKKCHLHQTKTPVDENNTERDNYCIKALNHGDNNHIGDRVVCNIIREQFNGYATQLKEADLEYPISQQIPYREEPNRESHVYMVIKTMKNSENCVNSIAKEIGLVQTKSRQLCQHVVEPSFMHAVQEPAVLVDARHPLNIHSEAVDANLLRKNHVHNNFVSCSDFHPTQENRPQCTDSMCQSGCPSTKNTYGQQNEKPHIAVECNSCHAMSLIKSKLHKPACLTEPRRNYVTTGHHNPATPDNRLCTSFSMLHQPIVRTCDHLRSTSTLSTSKYKSCKGKSIINKVNACVNVDRRTKIKSQHCANVEVVSPVDQHDKFETTKPPIGKASKKFRSEYNKHNIGNFNTIPTGFSSERDIRMTGIELKKNMDRNYRDVMKYDDRRHHDCDKIVMDQSEMVSDTAPHDITFNPQYNCLTKAGYWYE